MDPDANLAEQLKLAKAIIEAYEHFNEADIFIKSLRLCELVIALDEWITKGGFLPKGWRR